MVREQPVEKQCENPAQPRNCKLLIVERAQGVCGYGCGCGCGCVAGVVISERDSH